MGGETTSYDVNLRYVFKDVGAARGVKNLTREMDAAGAASSGLERKVIGLGTAIGSYLAVRAGKAAFVDFNSWIEQSTISLAAQEQMLLGGEWSGAMEHAGSMFSDYQQVAKKSIGTTQDFIDMHKMIAPAALGAGVGMEKLREMTVGATIAAGAFGDRADIVALDIKQMLAGTVTARDRFANMLLAGQKITQGDFNAMDAQKRIDVVSKALNSPALKNAAKQMENSFAGVTSTFKDNLQMGLGKIGLPLFKKITAEVQSWNAWIDKNPQKIEAFAKKLSDALVDGFGLIRDMAKFFVNNADTIISIAKVWAGLRIGAAIGGGTGGFFGGMMKSGRNLGTSFEALNTSTKGAAGGFKSMVAGMPAFVSNLANVAAGLGTLYIALSAFADWLDKRHDKQIEKDTTKGMWGQFGRDYLKRKAQLEKEQVEFRESATSGVNSGWNREKVISLSERYNKDAARMFEQGVHTGLITLKRDKDSGYITADTSVDGAAGFQKAMMKFTPEFAAAVNDAFKHNKMEQSDLIALWNATYGDPNAKNQPLTGNEIVKPVVNVNIARIEVQSNDPDRFVFALSEMGRRARKNPGQAKLAMLEG